MSTSGITDSGHDVKLTAGGDLAINAGVAMGSGNLTLTDACSAAECASIMAAGLQLLGSGTSVALNNANNDVTTLASSYSGLVSYTDHTGLTVGDRKSVV